MSQLSYQCEKDMIIYENEVNELFELFKKNFVKLYPKAIKLLQDDLFLCKLKNLAYKNILNKKIQDKHKEIYNCIIGAESCFCNLCTIGYDLIYQRPLLELATELEKITRIAEST